MKKEQYGECPECGCKDIDVYLLADYNSTIDSINGIGNVEWHYSDAMTDMYCRDCEYEFRNAKEVKVSNIHGDEEIVSGTRMFRAFENRKHMNKAYEDVVNSLPPQHRWSLLLWIGMYESTLVEGFVEDEDKS